MRKDILLPVLALTGGAAGFFLRRWQLAAAYQPEAGLFIHGAPSTLALLGLLGMLAVIFLLLIWDKGEKPADFLAAFRCPEAGQMALLAAAGLLLMAAGALGLWQSLQSVPLWRLAPEEYQLSTLAARLLAAALCLPAGAAILLMGRMTYRDELNDAACRLAPMPAFAGLVWLFACHLKHGIEPVLMKYGFALAAALLLTLAHYYIAGFLFDRPCRRRAAFLSLMGAVLGIVSLADRPDLFSAVAFLAYSLSALAFARALLRATFGPPWPKRLEGRMPPLEEEEQDE